MSVRRPVLDRSRLAVGALLVALVGLSIFAPMRTAQAAFPPPGTEVLPVTGTVSIESRIGQETITLSGTATFQRSAQYSDGGFEVQPAEIIALSLTGTSVTGPVSVSESPTLASAGELRSQQTSTTYPASSYFDVYARITIPASTGTPTVNSTVVRNDVPLHVASDPSDPIFTWPPYSAHYAATPDPCVPLVPALPKEICITSASFTVSGGVGGRTELPDVDVAAETHRGTPRGATATGAGILLAGLATAAGVALVARSRLRTRR